MDDWLIFRLALLVLLLGGSAFFAGCDIAFFSLTSAEVVRLKANHGKLGGRVSALLAHPQRLLVTIYIGNELINVAISAIATVVAFDLFPDTGVALFLGAGVLILLTLGEITPKAFAHSNNEKWALAASYPLTIFMYAIYPVQVLVTAITNWLARVFGGEMDTEATLVTEEELKTLMDDSADEGIIGEEEKEMIRGVFDLGDVTVSEIMTPRTDILALELGTALVDAWDKMAFSYFARAPVYDGSIDNIAGVLFKKDLLKLDYPPPGEMTLKDIIKEPFIVPESLMIKELLREFKKRKSHMAVVMDEYGGVQGVVTLDDILEELVGESVGQQRNGDEITRLGGGCFRIKASLSLESFNSEFGADLNQGEIETIGGLVFHLFGKAPKWGESIVNGGFQFTVEKVKGHRVTELRVRSISSPENGPNEGEAG